MLADENATLETDAILETNAIKLGLDNTKKGEAEKEKLAEQEAEIKKLKEKKEKKETIEKVTEAVAIDHIKSVWWRSFLGIFIKKYKIEAEKIKLARIIFSKSQNNNKTKEDDKYIWDKMKEYIEKSNKAIKTAPKSKISEQAGQTKQAKGGAGETKKNQDKEKTREQDNQVKTRQT